ncbi:hypothetical protein A5755_14110 [Mycolicibacterium fortuitum]|nr:hypothetical protein A5755_14110 [Mycolicibacterium fortuitum]
MHWRTARRILAASAAVLVVAGTGIAAATEARADGYLSGRESAYVVNYSQIVCDTIANHPSLPGVVGVARGVMTTGAFQVDGAEIYELLCDVAEDAARQALQPIRDRHKPLTIKCIESTCALGECDHDDDTCPEDIPVKVCAKCWEIADSINSYHSEEGIVDELLWPCDTAQLIYSTEELGA